MSHCVSSPGNVWFDLFTSNKTQPCFINLPFDSGMKKQYISSEQLEEFESGCTPLKINGWNLNITCLKRKKICIYIIWTKPPSLGSMWIFQGASLPTFSAFFSFPVAPRNQPTTDQLHPNSFLPSFKIKKKQPAESTTHREFPCFPTRPVVWHVLPHGTSAGVQTAPLPQRRLMSSKTMGHRSRQQWSARNCVKVCVCVFPESRQNDFLGCQKQWRPSFLVDWWYQPNY